MAADYIWRFNDRNATNLLMAGFVNTGTEILFNGSLAIPDVYPFSPGGVGGQLAGVDDFSVDLNTACNYLSGEND